MNVTGKNYIWKLNFCLLIQEISDPIFISIAFLNLLEFNYTIFPFQSKIKKLSEYISQMETLTFRALELLELKARLEGFNEKINLQEAIGARTHTYIYPGKSFTLNQFSKNQQTFHVIIAFSPLSFIGTTSDSRRRLRSAWKWRESAEKERRTR